MAEMIAVTMILVSHYYRVVDVTKNMKIRKKEREGRDTDRDKKLVERLFSRRLFVIWSREVTVF